MTRFLATLRSPSSNKGGLAIIDSDHGLVYLQSDVFPEYILAHQLRGIGCHKNSIYVATPASLLIYSVDIEPRKPYFRLTKEISRSEWLLGPYMQASLLGVLVSPRREQVLVANSYFNSVDVFSLEGDFIRRHFLSEVSPQLFTAPKKIIHPFRYGEIRSICETPYGSILLSIHDVNGSGEGCVINYDNGNVVIDNLRVPYGLAITKERLFVQEAGLARVSAYSYSSDRDAKAAKIWAETLANPDTASAAVNQFSRGLVHVGGSVYCGVFYSTKSVEENISSRIVSFDAATGAQNETEICLPDIEGFEQPRVFFMTPLPAELGTVEMDKSDLFLNGKQTSGIPPSIVKAVVRSGSQSIPKIGNPGIDKQKPAVIILEDVSLSYRRTAVSHFSFSKHLRKSKEFHALKKISFTIYEGETVGIIGRNGSGKSTIAMVISGALPADSGTLATRGHVQLLSIGLGFQQKLTGRENVFVNGALLGLRQKDITEKMSEIVDFAEIGEFIDEPVRTYSAGMRSRLGFAIATVVKPDILILDEVMSTGDAAFRRKADKRMASMREQIKTIVMVSHNSNTIRRMCARVIWLDKGELMMDGAPEDVLPLYNKL